MADDLPNEFDAVVVGTGMPESILAAALSRVGQSVLHIDRNDYYSGKWASFNFEGIERWLKKCEGQEYLESTIPDLDLGDGEHLVPVPLTDNSFSNVSQKFYVLDSIQQKLEKKSDKGDTPDKSENTEEETLIKGNNIQCESHDQPHDQPHDQSPDQPHDQPHDQSHDQPHDQSHDHPQNQSHNQSHDQSGDAAKHPDEDTCKDKTKTQPSEGETTAVKSSQEGEAPGSQKTAPEQAPVWTVESMKKEWRRFNIDIAPKLLYCVGDMVELLISSDVSKYCEFRTVTQMLTILNDKLQKVPCSRSDVFSSKIVSMIEKRMLMKFLTFCAEYEKHPEEYEEFRDKTFKEFLQSKNLSKTLKHYVQYSIAMVNDDDSTLDGLAKTKKFLHSLGRYGNTAFLWSMYGSGELPQSFCRLCAVFGGTYCLKVHPTHLILNKDNRCSGLVLNTGKKITCKWLVLESSYAPQQFKTPSENRYLNRAVLVTNEPLMEKQQLSLMSIPDPADGTRPCSVLELPSSTMACPTGLCMVHLSKPAVGVKVKPEVDLCPVMEMLFSPHEEKVDGKPKILWSLFYQQCIDGASSSDGHPDNVVVLGGPGEEIDLDGVVQQVKGIFEKILPGEEFLPRPPHPDDIIYVDEAEAQVNAEKPSEYTSDDADTATTGEATGKDHPDTEEKSSESESTQKTGEETHKEQNEKDRGHCESECSQKSGEAIDKDQSEPNRESSEIECAHDADSSSGTKETLVPSSKVEGKT